MGDQCPPLIRITRVPYAITRLVDRRAMLPSVAEMRVAKCAQMRTAVCTNGAKLTSNKPNLT